MAETDDPAFLPSPRIAPTRQLSSRGLLLALLATCVVPFTVLSIYTAIFGRATEHRLPVSVQVEQRPLPTITGAGTVLADVIVIENLADHEIRNVTIDLNSQYFLNRKAPLAIGEQLILPQDVFATKSSQRFVPGKYPITHVTVTGQLPSGARGVTEVPFGE